MTAAELREALEGRGTQQTVYDAARTIALPILEADPELVERLKVAIGQTFIKKMGWGESKPMAALEAYAMAEFQARAVLAAISTPTPGAE